MSLWSCEHQYNFQDSRGCCPQSFTSNLPKWEWRREKLSTLMEALGACSVLRVTLLIVTGIYVSVTIQLGSWISFSTTGSINFLNFSTLRKSETEWKSGSWSGSMQHRHLGLRCEAQPGVVLWAPQVRYSPLMWWLLCCRNDAPGVPRAVPAALSPICHRAESPREGLVVKHRGAQSQLCSLMFREGRWRKHSPFEFFLKS